MEPLITAMLADLNEERPDGHITVHFSRVKVTQISGDPSAKSQFNLDSMLSAASLLADAQVDAIGWGGTSAGWLGLDTDVQLCQAIERQFDIPAYTSTLALLEQLKAMQLDSVGLVTPYSAELNDAIVQNFAEAGVDAVTGYEPLSLTNNIEIGELPYFELEDRIQQILEADDSLQAVTTFCTNLKAADLVREWEQEEPLQQRGFRVLDSVSVLVWGLLWKLKVDPRGGSMREKWGELFQYEPTWAQHYNGRNS
ncbi:hypothetical protein H2198_008114 [Neophaeococcomyces mojaviensis]|uniref:Uncharacterized protein n=1 Tax=Neophaeococcomyces mojaviensis TaxID=3383035 RepID=A0ACC2ZY79_9EURO|nr:hypothetical protein H2198_008114 [Knufia sp. JES_112]